MSPKDRNILDVLNLLVLLRRAKKQALPKQTEEEQAQFLLTEEHLQMTGLTLPVFINALELLGLKGYLVFVSPFEKKAREEIARYQKSDDFSKAMEILATKDTKEMDAKLKSAVAETILSMAPKNMTLDMEGLMNDDQISFGNLLRDGHEHLMTYAPDTIATVLILPFRSIDRLLEKMNTGMKFDDVQDSGIWYDTKNFAFHFGDEVVSTASRNIPTVAHFILEGLFSPESKEPVVDFFTLSGFTDIRDKVAANKRFSDGMRHFVAKNPKISDIFTIYSDRVEIAEKYRGDVH